MENKFAQVVFDLPLDRTFTYEIPQKFSSLIRIGQPVLVPFGRRNLIGVVTAFLAEVPEELRSRIKKITEIPDPEIFLDEKLFSLTRWMSDYYFTPWGEVLSLAFPPNLKSKGTRKARIKVDEIRLPSTNRDRILTPAQRAADEEIEAALNLGKSTVILLHGITGSGKTEVYLQAVKKVIAQKRTALILVPEIFLTPVIHREFQFRFGGRVALLHSRFTPARRTEEWKKIYFGQADIVLGTRSALFAPLRNLGVIIIDEEHDPSYKQEEGLRYNAREIALRRAVSEKALVILGSATPSVESFYKAEQGEYKYLNLPERVEQSLLPDIRIIDLRQNFKGGLISPYLKEAIYRRLERREQVILFLNRRGSARFVQCPQCGYVVNCPNCSVALTYHEDTNCLTCHYCDFHMDKFHTCPDCQGGKINYLGVGTQKLETMVRKLFPKARVARMDRDTMQKKGAFEQIYQGLQDRQIDIVVGTQMITKGHDFPHMTLVGVVYADSSLNIADFRASERTFQLLTQVAGRAGRRKEQGEVVIQTYNPENFTVISTRNQDYREFYGKEIEIRRNFAFPPFTKIVVFQIETEEEKDGETAGQELKKLFEEKVKEDLENKNIEILGPAPANIFKKRNKFRWQMIIKGREDNRLHSIIKNVAADIFLNIQSNQVKIIINVDPLSFE